MESRQRDFKWFDEGFDGFPKHLPEDCVEYFMYIIDTQLTDSEIRSELRSVQSSANSLTKKLLKDYIWQRQSFDLELVHENGLSFLRGQTSYGDSVEDEWLIVYIMLELSKQYPSAWIRITDTDGEFLLIEAANVLPSWLNPEVGCFRPWVKGGRLLIIPDQASQRTQKTMGPQPQAITLQDALRFIQEKESMLLNSSLIEAEAFYRVQKFPRQITENLHNSMIQIPRKLAYVLHHKAAYISPAVEAFYLRDPISLRPLQTSDNSRLIFPPEDFVTVSAKFTKVGYAQVRSQQFQSPVSWQSHYSGGSDAKYDERVEIGMKVACGFEMMLSDPQNIDNPLVREIKLLLDDLDTEQDHLPSDAEISSWTNKEDDDSWLDIDFEKFEDELKGKAEKDPARAAHGFGDRGAQENLRKIVARFEDFLNDDSAGLDGAEFDTMDMDDDDDSGDETTSGESDSDGEDKGISFDEEQFNKMMREMMGMPADRSGDADIQSGSKSDSKHIHVGGADYQGSDDDDGDDDDDDDDDDGNSIGDVMKAMEAELANAGIRKINLERSSKNAMPLVQSPSSELQALAAPKIGMGQESDSDEVEIDYNLAKNLLESLKSQNGAPGPGGNLLGMMGMRLPRDENDD